MEDNFQTIVMALVAILVFFIFPTYVAYEKKDDLAYSIALKCTQTFVDDVRNKGYVSLKMYDQYIYDLTGSDNSYDVNIEHKRKTAVPVTNYYKKNAADIEKIVDFKNQESRGTLASEQTEIAKPEATRLYDLVENTYRIDEEVISRNEILAILNAKDPAYPIDVNDTTPLLEPFYQMNIGDEFIVTLKNTNTTFATIFYNLITISGSDSNTRIYVNYGGSITNETWTKAKTKYIEYTNLTPPVATVETIPALATNTLFDGIGAAIGSGNKIDSNNFVIEFEAFPTDTTQLPAEGTEAPVGGPGNRLYNYIVRNGEGSSASNAGLGISIGINGISVILHSSTKQYAVLTYNEIIEEYSSFKIIVKDKVPTLYINGIEVAEGIAPPSPITSIFTEVKVGQGYEVGQGFKGNVMNFKFYEIS